MFTGLIEETGIVKQIIENSGETPGREFMIYAVKVIDDLKKGDSIAVNGVCQTVETIDADTFSVYSVPETLAVSNLAQLKKGAAVNLERPLKPHDRLGGHIVQGHVEQTARVKSINKFEKHTDIEIFLNSPYLVPKGSIAIDGISLTIHSIFEDYFSIQIIPETIARTNIDHWEPGTIVNIETDYLIKALDTMVQWYKKNN